LIEILRNFHSLVFQKKFVNRGYLVYWLIQGVTLGEVKLIHIYKGVAAFMIIQLRGGFDKRQSKIEVLHLVELLAIEHNPFQHNLNAGQIGRTKIL
jgi:hypothetical protein